MNMYAAAFIVSHTFLAHPNKQPKQPPLLHVIANEIREHKIAKLVVLQYPQNAGSLFTITPAELNKVYQFRTEIRHLSRWGRTRELMALLKTPTGVAGPKHSPREVRWACLFYDSKDNQRHTIYLNPPLTTCYVDGKIGTIPKKMSPWLKHVFGGNLERDLHQ